MVCAATAHVATDECGAPERLLGVKLLTVDTPDGKLTPAHVDAAAVGFGDEHRVQPRVVSISQSTELGTVYTPSEIAALGEAAHELGMQLHVDGARIANAAAALGCSLADLTSACGVDALSLGATKNGGLGAEAVVLLRPRARSPLRVPAQAVDAARVQDALPRRPAGGPLRRRPLAAQRRARQRHGPPAGRRPAVGRARVPGRRRTPSS